jgi:3-oxoacyl-[acyl-carrier protein] reductase
MNLDFTNKVTIVTGGENGIGRGIAEMFLSLGSTVYITGLKNQPEWCKKYENCLYRTLNFLNQESIDLFVSEISNLNKIDILVNNAGIQIMQSIDKIQTSDWNKVLEVNLTGPMKIMNTITPIMMAAKEGKILNISSVAGIISKPGQSSYSASKSGLIGLTRSCALDLAPHNVLVNALCPGTTQTPMVESVLSKEQKKDILINIPMNRFATITEIANFGVFLCSDMNTYMTGQTVVVDGGFTSK